MSSVSKCFAKTILLWCEEMLLKNSLTSGLTNKSEQLTVQKMTDILITVNYRKWTSLAKRLMSNDNAQHNVAFACCCCYRQECSCSASWYWIDWRSPAEHPRQCRCRGLPYPKRECVIIPRYCWALWQYARGRAASDTKATPQSESQRATLSKQGCYLAGDRKDDYRKWTSLAKRLMSNDNAQHNVAFACCCCYRQECSCSASWYWIDWRSPAEHPRQCRCRGLPYPKRECVIIPRYCWALWQYARGRAASDTKATPQSESQRATLSKQGCYLAGDRKDATLTKQECYKQTLKCSIVYCICNTLILWQTLANCITSMILLLSAQIQKVL